MPKTRTAYPPAFRQQLYERAAARKTWHASLSRPHRPFATGSRRPTVMKVAATTV